MIDADTPATRADFAELAAEIRAMTGAVSAAFSDTRLSPTGGDARIVVHAGGAALWVAATCCAVMLTVMVPMVLGLYWVAMDSRDRGHQINALFQSTPGLRELVERQVRLNEKTQAPPQSEKTK